MKHQIKQLRQKHNLTQMEFAEKIGTNQKDICRWELGIVSPSLKMIKRIQQIFRIKLEI